MKNFKKLVAVVLAVMMVAGCAALASCGKKDETTSTDELLIGGIGPLSGDYANYGNSVKQGAELAVEEINAAGGVNGFKLKLSYQDSKGDKADAVAAYGKLVDNGMKLSLGGVLSGETADIIAAAKDDGILVLTPSGSATNILKGNDAAFRVCFSDASQGVASADYIGTNNLPKKVAVFYQADTDYSKGLLETFKTRTEANGIEIVEEQSFTDDTKTDFTTQITAIQNSGAEMIFIPIYASEAATFLTQAKGKFSSDMIYFGCDGLDGILTKIEDTADAENVMLLTPFSADSKNEKVQKFVKDYGDKFGGAVPDQFAADGYDAIYVLKAAIEKAGLKPDDMTDFNTRVVAAMTQIEVEGVTGTMTWDETGETTKGALAMIIHDGVASLYGQD
ncbi:MAG: ABC transporter substrate-binding protein [Eubacteriales bacterium]